ncbi:MAG: hypothetical protein WC402_04430 [Candidatus Pacearchaeota archaeon]|jgi:hypothetical protein
MDCAICKKSIEKYDSNFNHLIINESCEVDLCQDCINKIFKWQGELYAKLFPTSAMKKRFKGKNKY